MESANERQKRKRGTGTVRPVREKFQGGFYHLGRRIWLDVLDTYEAAEEQLDTTLAELVRSPDQHAKTLRTYAPTVFDARELDGYRSVDDDRSRFKSLVMQAEFIDWPLEDITPGAVRGWVRRISKGHASNTITNALNCLRQVLNFAVEVDEILDTNVAEGVRVSKPKKRDEDDEQIHFFTLEELEIVRGFCTDEEWDLVEIAHWTGWRQGEMRSLLLEDLHAAAKEQNPRARIRFGSPGLPPKSQASRRVVPLFGRGLDAVRRWLDRLPTFCPDNDRKLAFPTARAAVRGEGRMLGRTYLGKDETTGKPVYVDRWASILEQAGLRTEVRSLNWHSLRHTAATNALSGLWGRAWSIEEVQALLGHEDISTTQRYAKFVSSALEAAARDTHLRITLGSRQVGGFPPGAGIYGAPPAGIGPATFGLGTRAAALRSRALALAGDPSVICREILVATAAGEGARASALADELAAMVLGSAAVGLAEQVLAGGVHKLDRALDLAALFVGDAEVLRAAGAGR